MNKENLLHPELTFPWLRDKLVLPKSDKGFPVKINGESLKAHNIKLINGNIVITSNTNYMCINKDGKILGSDAHPCYNPVLKTCGDKIIFYDLNGNDLQIRFKSVILERIKCENKLLSAAVSGGNVYATVSLDKLGISHLKFFKLFCKDPIYNKEICGENIVEIGLNESGTFAVTLSNFNEEDAISSKIKVIDVKKGKEKYCITSRNNKLFYVDYISNNNILCMGNNSFLVVNTKNGQYKEYNFNNEILTDFSPSMNDGFCVATSASGPESDHNFSILLFDKDGKLKKTIKTDLPIKAISYRQGCVAVFSPGILNLYKMDGQNTAKLECKENVKNIKLTSSNQVIIVTSDQVLKKSFSN